MGDEALSLVSSVVEKNIKLLCGIYCSFAVWFHYPLETILAHSSD
jgi:hypothetical protein